MVCSDVIPYSRANGSTRSRLPVNCRTSSNGDEALVPVPGLSLTHEREAEADIGVSYPVTP